MTTHNFRPRCIVCGEEGVVTVCQRVPLQPKGKIRRVRLGRILVDSGDLALANMVGPGSPPANFPGDPTGKQYYGSGDSAFIYYHPECKGQSLESYNAFLREFSAQMADDEEWVYDFEKPASEGTWRGTQAEKQIIEAAVREPSPGVDLTVDIALAAQRAAAKSAVAATLVRFDLPAADRKAVLLELVVEVSGGEFTALAASLSSDSSITDALPFVDEDIHVERKRVYLESPFAGDRERNAAYLKACMLDSLRRGEAPFASHALYTQFLDDDVPADRELGINAGLVWGETAELTVVYTDLGVSPGMQLGIERARSAGRPIEERSLPGWTWTGSSPESNRRRDR
jgi:hypothetical protein